MVMALAGNKADLEDKRKVPAEVYAWFFHSTMFRIFYLLMELVVIFIFFFLSFGCEFCVFPMISFLLTLCIAFELKVYVMNSATIQDE